jgi:hypothetical protein
MAGTLGQRRLVRGFDAGGKRQRIAQHVSLKRLRSLREKHGVPRQRLDDPVVATVAAHPGRASGGAFHGVARGHRRDRGARTLRRHGWFATRARRSRMVAPRP